MLHGLISGTTGAFGSGLEAIGGALKSGGEGGGGGGPLEGEGPEAGEAGEAGEAMIAAGSTRRTRKDQFSPPVQMIGGALETVGSGIKAAGEFAGNVAGGLTGEGSGGDSAMARSARRNAGKFPSPEE